MRLEPGPGCAEAGGRGATAGEAGSGKDAGTSIRLVVGPAAAGWRGAAFVTSSPAASAGAAATRFAAGGPTRGAAVIVLAAPAEAAPTTVRAADAAAIAAE